jgi:hypothetical protein
MRHGEEVPEEEGPSQERREPRQAPQLLTAGTTLIPPHPVDHEVNVMIDGFSRGYRHGQHHRVRAAASRPA